MKNAVKSRFGCFLKIMFEQFCANMRTTDQIVKAFGLN